jgi:hypothetical protein
MRISIMQPYFIPYAGYFRLFHDVDLFVIYDDVHLTKPGFVHRSQLTTKRGAVDWLTIPLRAKPLATDIKDIEFAESCAERWQKARSRFKIFDQRPLPFLSQNVALMCTHKKPIDFILSTTDIACGLLDLTSCKIIKSSKYKWSMFNRGQERAIEMCKKFGATEYVHAPDSESYDPAVFEEAGIKLKVLKPYEGSKLSILERLAYEERRGVREEIIGNYEFI